MNIQIRSGYILPLLLTLAGLNGCSTTTTYTNSRVLNSHEIEVIQSQVQGTTANIQLHDGTSVEGENFRIQPDSLFCEVDSGRIGIPMTSIQSMSGIKHVEGMVEGGGIGFLGGAILGAGLLAIISGDDNDVDYAAGIGLVLRGTVGLIGGIIYGGIEGHSYNYQFTNE